MISIPKLIQLRNQTTHKLKTFDFPIEELSDSVSNDEELIFLDEICFSTPLTSVCNFTK
jgi:hypothetical protein